MISRSACSKKWNFCPDEGESRRLFNSSWWKKHEKVIFGWKFMIFWWKFEAKTSYTCQKSEKSWFLIGKVNFRSSSRSVKSLRDWLQKFRVNLEGFLLVVREKSKKWKRCNFFRRVRRFRIKILSFFELRNVFQSYSAFQSKKGNVSWQKFAKSEKWSKFPPFGLCFSGRDENRFLASSTPEPCANQCFLVHFARPDIFHSNRDFACSLLVKNLMVF